MQGFDEQEGNITTLLDISQCIKNMEEWTDSNKSSTGKHDCSVSKNWTSLLIESKRLDSFVSTTDLIRHMAPRIAEFVRLFYNLPVKLVMRSTDQPRLLPVLLLLMTTRSGSILKSPGMVRLKTRTCKPSLQFPLRKGCREILC